eukprot:superscaffoldBa00000122_g1771
MAGRETDGDSNSIEFSKGDERRESEWEKAVRGSRAMKTKDRKRKKKEGASSGGTEDEGKDPKAGSLNVVVRFEGEGGVK